MIQSFIYAIVYLIIIGLLLGLALYVVRQLGAYIAPPIAKVVEVLCYIVAVLACIFVLLALVRGTLTLPPIATMDDVLPFMYRVEIAPDYILKQHSLALLE
jgi:hypothetical protein